MTETVLILGANGMLGSSIFRYLTTNSNYEVVGSVRSQSAQQSLSKQGFNNVRTGIDVVNDIQLTKLFNDLQPQWVINCVGVIKQLDQAKAPVPSITINSLLPHRLAMLCNQTEARLVHFSTDCVFSGSQGKYTELNTPDAKDLYGRSKLLGEVDYGNHLTLRTSIIGHELNGQVSLVDWFLSQKESVKGFSKAIFSGLPTVYVAEFLAQFVLPYKHLNGLYHLSTNPIDKYTLLKLVNDVYQCHTAITESRELVIDRSLDSSRLRIETGYEPLSWPDLIRKMNNEYQAYFARG